MLKDDRLIRDMDSMEKCVEDMTDEEIEKEFEQVIKEKMSDDEFWNWVRSWKDAESLIKEALDSNLGDMEDTIRDFRSGKFI